MVKIVIIYRYTLYFQTFSFAVTARTSEAFFVPFEQYFTQKYIFLISRNISVTEKSREFPHFGGGSKANNV